jgi:histidyl-tRNA synthetase
MIEVKDTCYKGVRILLGNEKRQLINQLIDMVMIDGFEEISIPIIQYQSYFVGKVGEENNNLMFNFVDRGGRNVCLAPEYTAIIQQLALSRFKYQKDVKLFYVQECFRGEKPQEGRYRQFTQFGVEILNPSKDYSQYLANLALEMVTSRDIENFEVTLKTDVVRGLDYYKGGKGFEISCEALGAQKQICGGGEYEGGVGFAVGLDRLLLIN